VSVISSAACFRILSSAHDSASFYWQIHIKGPFTHTLRWAALRWARTSCNYSPLRCALLRCFQSGKFMNIY